MLLKSIKVLFFIIACAPFTYAQNSKAEQEVLKVNSDYEKAMLKGDVSFQERILAPEYISYRADGSSINGAQAIEEGKKEKAAPTFKSIASSSNDVKVKVFGNLAVVTGSWESTLSSMETDAAPRNYRGYYTSVYEKRAGRWLLVSEHATEKRHTPEELEPELRKASDDFDKALETKNGAMFEKLLTDDFTHTSVSGQMTNKKEGMAHMTSPDLVFTSNKADDKKFRIYRNSAVETGRYTATGTNKGKPFSETGRYTTTWFYKNGKWQMVADHASVIPEKNTSAGTEN